MLAAGAAAVTTVVAVWMTVGAVLRAIPLAVFLNAIGHCFGIAVAVLTSTLIILCHGSS